MYTIDLNADLGESFGAYNIGQDSELLQWITSANIACGLHAGDPIVMERTVGLAQQRGIAIGAHPGFPDLQGFGRRNMVLAPMEVKAFLLYQIGALAAFVRSAGATLHHVKPHGALYTMAARDRNLARAIAEAVSVFDPNLSLMALAGSQMVEEGHALGISTIEEAFADRGYDKEGNLIPRSQPGAIIRDPQVVAIRAVQMIRSGFVQAVTGEQVPLSFQSLCIHGDNPNACAIAQAVHQAMVEEGIVLQAV
jgi:UPF0271 protein